LRLFSSFPRQRSSGISVNLHFNGFIANSPAKACVGDFIGDLHDYVNLNHRVKVFISKEENSANDGNVSKACSEDFLIKIYGVAQSYRNVLYSR
jgi:hypothetical protein